MAGASPRELRAARRDAFRDAAAVFRIRLAEVLERALDDVLARDLREAARDVVDEPLLRVRRLQAVEIAGLLEVVDFARALACNGR